MMDLDLMIAIVQGALLLRLLQILEREIMLDSRYRLEIRDEQRKLQALQREANDKLAQLIQIAILSGDLKEDRRSGAVWVDKSGERR